MAVILVTGGAGYIGSHACKALARAGHQPVTYDSLVTGREDAVRYGPFERGCLHDAARLAEVFARWRPEAVLHFAALSNVGEATLSPGCYWRNNVGGTLNLLDAMVAAGCGRIVFSSTCAVYGDRDGEVLDEATPFSPLNAYGGSKAAVEAMLADYGRAHGLAHVSFRYFNVAGASSDGEIGEAHDPETHLIPLALQAATGRREALHIFGSDYPTPDGTCIRDYVHVEDLVEAHLMGLDHLTREDRRAAFNLGTGKGFSVREVIDAVEQVTGLKVPTVAAPRRAGDAVRLVSGSDLAWRELGWVPRRSALEQMIGSAFAWHQRGAR